MWIRHEDKTPINLANIIAIETVSESGIATDPTAPPAEAFHAIKFNATGGAMVWQFNSKKELDACMRNITEVSEMVEV